MTLFRVAAMLWAAVAMGGAATGPGRSDMAAAILTDTGLARQAIARHDRQAALDHVGDAIAQAGKILATVPKPSPPGPVLVPVYRGPVKRGSLDVGSAPTGSKPRGRYWNEATGWPPIRRSRPFPAA